VLFFLLLGFDFLPAQSLPLITNLHFGDSQSQLQSRIANLRRPSKRHVASDGSRELLELPAASLGGHSFSVSFYFRRSKLHRVEQKWTSDTQPCTAQQVLLDVTKELDASLGLAQIFTGTDAKGAPQQSSVWTLSESQLTAFLDQGDGRCNVILLLKPVVAGNADEL